MKNNNSENKISCDAVKDLLPLYGENLTRPATDLEIKSHLTRCEACRKFYEELSGAKFEPGNQGELPEIDYLKKVRKKSRNKAFAWVGATLAVIVAAVLLKLFVFGWPVTCYVPLIQADGAEITVSAVLYDSGVAFSHFKVKPAENGQGGQELVVYGCLPSFIHGSGSFSYQYPSGGESLNVNGSRILADGTLITKLAFDLYAAKNPYIGDMSANGRIANLLGINENMGSYENHLKTGSVPYGWRFDFQDAQYKSNIELYNSSMTSYAYVLLALVENCDIIGWNGSTHDGSLYHSVTAGQATAALGKNVKDFAKSPESIQELLNASGIK